MLWRGIMLAMLLFLPVFHLELTCDILKSFGSTCWTVNLLHPALSATSRTVWRQPLSVTSFTTSAFLLSSFDSPPHGALSIQQSTIPLALVYQLLRHCLVAICVLEVFICLYGCHTPWTQNSMTVLHAVSSLSVTISNEIQWKLAWHSKNDDARRSKLSITT